MNETLMFPLFGIPIFYLVALVVLHIVERSTPEWAKRFPSFMWLVLILIFVGRFIAFGSPRGLTVDISVIVGVLLIPILPIGLCDKVRWGLNSLGLWLVGTHFKEAGD